MNTFFPKTPPLKSFKTKSKSLNLLSNIASSLPKLLLTNKVQPTIDRLNKDALSVNKLFTNKNIRK